MSAPLAFYNEHDPKAAAWLLELIAQGHIAPGVVDERSISDIAPDELAGFTQCHFFAGIGVWPLALRAAGWADDRPVWTGSCPCQPFSAAGKGDGFDDERHLWPDWHWLIGERRPPVILGEQVASKDALVWIDLVSSDLERAGYAFGAADLCAAGAGLEAFGESVWSERLSRAIHLCPDPVVAGALRDFADFAGRNLGGEHGGHHIRQRAYFVGLADVALGGLGELGDALGAWQGGHPDRGSDALSRVADDIDGRWGQARGDFAPTRDDGSIGDGTAHGLADGNGRDASAEWQQRRREQRQQPQNGRPPLGVAHPDGSGFAGPGGSSGAQEQRASELRGAGGLSDPANDHRRRGERGPQAGTWADGFGWRGPAIGDGRGDAHAPNRSRGDADWLFCRDGKWRAVEPGTFPLAHAAPARVGLLRGYGNALDLETAIQWIETVKAHLDGRAVERLAA